VDPDPTLRAINDARAELGLGPLTAAAGIPELESPELRAINDARMVIGLEPLMADGWNPTKQLRDSFGRWRDMPSIRARLRAEARAKARIGDRSGTPNPMPNPMPNPQQGEPERIQGAKEETPDEKLLREIFGRPAPKIETNPEWDEILKRELGREFEAQDEIVKEGARYNIEQMRKKNPDATDAELARKALDDAVYAEVLEHRVQQLEKQVGELLISHFGQDAWDALSREEQGVWLDALHDERQDRGNVIDEALYEAARDNVVSKGGTVPEGEPGVQAEIAGSHPGLTGLGKYEITGEPNADGLIPIKPIAGGARNREQFIDSNNNLFSKHTHPVTGESFWSVRNSDGEDVVPTSGKPTFATKQEALDAVAGEAQGEPAQAPKGDDIDIDHPTRVDRGGPGPTPEEPSAEVGPLGLPVEYERELQARDDFRKRLAAAQAEVPDGEDFGMVKPGPEHAPVDPNIDPVEWAASRPGMVEDIIDGQPGPTMQKHLDALLNYGRVINEELERRIRNRRRGDHGDIEAAKKDLKEAEEMMAMGLSGALMQASLVEKQTLKKFNDSAKKAGLPPDMTFDTVEEARYTAIDPDASQARQAAAEAVVGMMDRAVAASDAVAGWENIATIQNNRIAALRNAIAATKTNDLLPGTEAYNQAQREEAIELLDEILPEGMGGQQTFKIVVPPQHKEPVETAMDQAKAAYPHTWHQRLRAKLSGRPFKVTVSDRGEMVWPTRKIEVSPKKKLLEDGNEFTAVAVHELGHGMEVAMAQLRRMEWAFSHYRSPRDQEGLKAIYGKPEERGYRDKFANPYTGKIYKNDQHMEIFTTGMEALMAGGPYFIRALENGDFDHEFRALILAMLARG